MVLEVEREKKRGTILLEESIGSDNWSEAGIIHGDDVLRVEPIRGHPFPQWPCWETG